MSRLHSYSSIYALGHRAVQDILTGGRVVVQEKIDGSQFSFGVFIEATGACHAEHRRPECETGACDQCPAQGREAVLIMKSKGAQVYPETKDKLFGPAVATITRLFAEGKLTPGYTYRGEVIARPKHNTLAYDRVPSGNVILFDIDLGEESYASPSFVQARAEELGLETVPTVFEGEVTSLEQVHGFLDRVSVLGGSKIEGVVIKAYGRYGPDKKTLMAKYVSEAFKEVHQGTWRKENPTRSDVVQLLIEKYKTPARWQKAVQHLRERDELQDAPQDIGKLLIEVAVDVEKEEAAEISAALYKFFWPHIRRGITGGLPQWYKDELAKTAFVPQSAAEIIDPRPVEATVAV